ncbi:hypothetical protein HDU91_005754 [Kappamyces sp. JEL0680]|nr:hypothetical protein HDU91_005754 [Kappamyces sp. JEL0680]
MTVSLAVLAAACIPQILAGKAPVPPQPATPQQSKIQNVVMVMMENRAFDTIFGYLDVPNVDNLVGKKFCNYLNPNDTSSMQICSNMNQVDITPYGPNHGYDQTTQQLYGTSFPTDIANAPMSGFVAQAHAGSMSGAKGDPKILEQIMEFTVFDRWFSCIPGPTQPNRACSHTATSAGWFDNNAAKLALGTPARSIQQDIAEAGLTWKTYFQEEPSFFFLRNTRLDMAKNTRLYSEFLQDAKNGKLANYTYLEPLFGELPSNRQAKNANDGHAGDAYFHNAEYFLKELYETIRNSPQWESTLLLITYDEHGGYWDHVPPPLAPNPDGITTYDKNLGVTYEFNRLGVRVPTIAVSPWVGKGQVVHKPNGPYPDSEYSHASIPATLRSLFNLPTPPLTKREAWSGSFDDILLDSPRQDTPTVLPAVDMRGF